MKIFRIAFLVSMVCFLYNNDAFGQKPVNEATVIYKIAIEAVNDNPSLSKQLEGATLTNYIKATESRSDMVSALGTESNIFDSRTGKGYIMKEYSGQKLMITLTRNNWEQKNQYFQNMVFTIDHTAFTIAGFKCNKANAKLAEGYEFVIYFMPDIVMANKEYNNAFSHLPGIPVQYEIKSGKLKFTYTLTGISYDNIPAAKFDLPKSGFRIMTYDENQQLKKG